MPILALYKIREIFCISNDLVKENNRQMKEISALNELLFLLVELIYDVSGIA